jgi:hypothetical protein
MSQIGQLEELLGKLFDGVREGLRAELPPDEYERRRHEFVFHMTDWKDDLERLAELFKHPDRQDEEAVSTLLIGFLYHVVPHVTAAGRLLLDRIDDPFTESDEGQSSKNRSASATTDPA